MPKGRFPLASLLLLATVAGCGADPGSGVSPSFDHRPDRVLWSTPVRGGTLKLGAEGGALCLVVDRDRAAAIDSWLPEQAGASCVTTGGDEGTAIPLPTGVGASPLADAYALVWLNRSDKRCTRESSVRLDTMQCGDQQVRLVLTASPENYD